MYAVQEAASGHNVDVRRVPEGTQRGEAESEMSEPLKNKQRYDRLAQQRHRGSKTSYVTEIENLQILIAHEAGELSEGQAMKALGCTHRVEVRDMRLSAVYKGKSLVERERNARTN